MMCTSTPTDLGDWLEGEQFYIKCSYHSLFKVNGYLAAVKEDCSDHESDSYKITTVFLAAGKDFSETGMLFRLHPKETKEFYEQIQVDVAEESPSPELPPADSAEDFTHTGIPPPTHAALSNQLLIPAIVVGTAGMLMYVVFRSLSA